MPLRKITANLEEDDRYCSYCDKSLTGETGMLYIVLPGMNVTLEFCSWYCLYTYVKELLEEKTLNARILESDMLSQLGWTRVWGSDIPKNELEDHIVDPIEDLPLTKPKEPSNVKKVSRSKSKGIRPAKKG